MRIFSILKFIHLFITTVLVHIYISLIFCPIRRYLFKKYIYIKYNLENKRKYKSWCMIWSLRKCCTMLQSFIVLNLLTWTNQIENQSKLTIIKFFKPIYLHTYNKELFMYLFHNTQLRKFVIWISAMFYRNTSLLY